MFDQVNWSNTPMFHNTLVLVRVRPAHLVEHQLPHWPPFREMPTKRTFSGSSAWCSTSSAGRTSPCSITLWWLVRQMSDQLHHAQLDLRFLDSNSLSCSCPI